MSRSWWQRLTEEKPRGSRRSRWSPYQWRARPRVEPLEDRWLPAVLTLTGVSPAAITEHASTTLSGDVTTIAAVADFSLTIDWGGTGAAAEGVSGFTIPTPGTLVDGQQIASNSGPTAVLTVIAPTADSFSFTVQHQYLDDNPTGDASNLYTIRGIATDDGGASPEHTIQLTVNNAAPVVSGVSVNDDTLDENQTVTLTATVTDTGTLDTQTVSVNWGGTGADAEGISVFNINTRPGLLTDGGTFNSISGPTAVLTIVSHTTNSFTFTVQHQYRDDNPTATLQDNYTISVSSTDDDTSTSAGGAGTTAAITVSNLDPVVALSAVTDIDEDGNATLNGVITDVGTLDTFTLALTWGDPLSPPITQNFTLANVALTKAVDGIDWNPVTRAFSVDHRYLDDNPSNTSQDTYTITAQATDDDGGVSDFAPGIPGPQPTIRTVLVRNLAPVVSGVQVNDATLDENDTVTVTATVTDTGTLDTQTVSVNWGGTGADAEGISVFNVNVRPGLLTDGQTFSSASGPTAVLTIQSHTANSFTFTVQHQYLDDNPTATTTDNYTISVSSTDDDTGLSAGGAGTTAAITVSNLPPVVSGVSVNDATLDENDTVTVTATVTDTGTRDTQTVSVNWGGTGADAEGVSVFNVNVRPGLLTDGQTFSSVSGPTAVLIIQSHTANSFTFTVQHQYLDDNPTATTTDNYTISVSSTDDDGGVSVAGAGTTAAITVSNLAPAVSGVSVNDDTLDENQTITLTATVTDTGTLDTQTVSVNWGGTGADAEGISVFNVNVRPGLLTDGQTFSSASGPTAVLTIQSHTANSFTFTVQHQYLDDNPTATTVDNYTISVSSTDDDGGVSVAGAGTTAAITVSNLAPVVSAVQVNGAATATIDENDIVTVRATVTDTGTQDSQTVSVNWGGTGANAEGISVFAVPRPGLLTLNQTINSTAGPTAVLTIVTLTANSFTFTAQHLYLDDNPTATAQDNYTVSVSSTDDDGGVSAAVTATVTVRNVAPVVSAVQVNGATTATIDENDTATLQATVTDTGTRDTQTVSVNWGGVGADAEGISVFNITVRPALLTDGQTFNSVTGPTAVLTIVSHTANSFTFTSQHKYLDDNPTATAQDNYTVSVSSTDDDGGISLAGAGTTATVTVRNVPPTLSGLQVGRIEGGNFVEKTEIDEHDVAVLRGTFKDPGTLDVITLEIDWDDPNDPDDATADGDPDGTGTTASIVTFLLGNTAAIAARIGGPDLVVGTSALKIRGQRTEAVTGHTLFDFEITHRYLDDGRAGTGTPNNPTPRNNTVRDLSKITVQVKDDDLGASDSDALLAGAQPHVVNLYVADVRPTISDVKVGRIEAAAFEERTEINEHDEGVLQVKFSDPGTLDYIVVEIDWDDPNDPDDATADTDPDGTGNTSEIVRFSLGRFKDIVAGQTANGYLGAVPGDTPSGDTLVVTNVTAGVVTFRATHRYLDDGRAGTGTPENPTPRNNTARDLSKITVQVKDDDTLASDSDAVLVGDQPHVIDLYVADVRPTISEVKVGRIEAAAFVERTEINEHDEGVLQVKFSDPGTLDYIVIEIDWDDPNDPDDATADTDPDGTGNTSEIVRFSLGRFKDIVAGQTADGYLGAVPGDTPSGDTLVVTNVTAGVVTFRATHRYLDDGRACIPGVPRNNTARDLSKIMVQVKDDDTKASDSDAVLALEQPHVINLYVANLDPTLTNVEVGQGTGLDFVPTSEINEYTTATVKGRFSDRGTLDCLFLEIDWDDPNGPSDTSAPIDGSLNPLIDSTGTTPSIVRFSLGDAADTALLVGQTLTIGTTKLTITGTGGGGGGGPTVFYFEATHQYLDDGLIGVGTSSANRTARDLSKITVQVKDDDTGVSALHTPNLYVNNVATTLSLDRPNDIVEGGFVVLTGWFEDQGRRDIHRLRVDWNDPNFAGDSDILVPAIDFLTVNDTYASADGVQLTVTKLEGNKVFFQMVRLYVDDGPIGIEIPSDFFYINSDGAPSNTSPITVWIRDDDKPAADTDSVVFVNDTFKTTEVVVINVAPVLETPILSDTIITTNSPVTVSGRFTDRGTQDLHRIIINWGDGTTPQTLYLARGAREYSATRTINNGRGAAAAGSTIEVTITVTVEDGDAGRDTKIARPQLLPTPDPKPEVEEAIAANAITVGALTQVVAAPPPPALVLLVSPPTTGSALAGPEAIEQGVRIDVGREFSAGLPTGSELLLPTYVPQQKALLLNDSLNLAGDDPRIIEAIENAAPRGSSALPPPPSNKSAAPKPEPEEPVEVGAAADLAWQHIFGLAAIFNGAALALRYAPRLQPRLSARSEQEGDHV